MKKIIVKPLKGDKHIRGYVPGIMGDKSTYAKRFAAGFGKKKALQDKIKSK